MNESARDVGSGKEIAIANETGIASASGNVNVNVNEPVNGTATEIATGSANDPVATAQSPQRRATRRATIPDGRSEATARNREAARRTGGTQQQQIKQ